MTEERLKEIYRDVSHSAHEEMSTDNIHLMAMKQAVNEAIEEFKNIVLSKIDKRIISDGEEMAQRAVDITIATSDQIKVK